MQPVKNRRNPVAETCRKASHTASPASELAKDRALIKVNQAFGMIRKLWIERANPCSADDQSHPGDSMEMTFNRARV